MYLTWKKRLCLKYLKFQLNNDLKIIFLDYQNNYIRHSSMMSTCHILTLQQPFFYIIILMVQQNYFQISIYRVKLLDPSAILTIQYYIIRSLFMFRFSATIQYIKHLHDLFKLLRSSSCNSILSFIKLLYEIVENSILTLCLQTFDDYYKFASAKK